MVFLSVLLICISYVCESFHGIVVSPESDRLSILSLNQECKFSHYEQSCIPHHGNFLVPFFITHCPFYKRPSLEHKRGLLLYIMLPVCIILHRRYSMFLKFNYIKYTCNEYPGKPHLYREKWLLQE